jgi:hypothetical protein
MKIYNGRFLGCLIVPVLDIRNPGFTPMQVLNSKFILAIELREL